MRPGRSQALLGSCVTSAVTVLAANVAAPQALRIGLGVAMVFGVPGFATVCAVVPRREFPLGECLLASLGISLAISVCMSVLLAATPIGLTRNSLAAVLGGSTIVVSIYAWRRTPRTTGQRSRS